MAAFSYSRIGSFETCPKKYEFAYILKAPKGPSGIEAFLGNMVHEALEWLYAEVGFCKTPSADDLVRRYHELWSANWSDDVAIVRAGRTAEDYEALGEKQLRSYHDRYAPFDQGATVGLELRIDFPLDEAGEFRVMGYVDRLTKAADGVWEIHDYKTGNSLPTQADADADGQLALYELGIRSMYPDAREVVLVWHYLAFDQEIRSTRTPEQLEQLRADTIEAIRSIESTTEFPASTSRLCDWCDYFGICPAHKHEAQTAALPPDEFAQEPGVVLVDRYMAVCDQLSELEAEKDRLKDAIVARAGAEGLDSMVGSDYAVRVYRFQNVQLPPYTDPSRTALEAVLKEEGAWERFSQLATVALAKAIQAKDLPSGTLKRLAPFLTTSEGARLYPRKRT